MSKAEILEQLPKLKPAERREIFDKLCELEGSDLIAGRGPTPEERELLDREIQDYQAAPEAGASWEQVKPRIRGGQET